jgi:hypothetical protein
MLVRNLCEGSEHAREAVAALRLRGTEGNDEAARMGLELTVNELEGKVRVRPVGGTRQEPGPG